jgi:hypothetical protein
MLITDKEDFKSNLVRREKDNHVTLIKGKINRKDEIVVNICKK